ncbi:MAG TPA: hypothetical protein DEO91_15675, partial [Pseudomonas sp.]|nr:hypothetical protein [Pseudomonas sp.]
AGIAKRAHPLRAFLVIDLSRKPSTATRRASAAALIGTGGIFEETGMKPTTRGKPTRIDRTGRGDGK